MTCGAEECQRERHAERCRAWHVANRDVGTSHYADVVKPFREAQPDYQRRWRLAVRCREIREKTGTLGGVLLTSLRALLGRADVLAGGARGAKKTGVLSGDLLDAARRALRDAMAAIERLEASLATLQTLGS